MEQSKKRVLLLYEFNFGYNAVNTADDSNIAFREATLKEQIICC